MKKEEANQKNKDSSKEINASNFGFPPTAETTYQNSYNFNEGAVEMNLMQTTR